MPELEVFLSWSKSSSHQATQALKDWLPDVLPGTRPWMSSEDITKGTPWFSSISAQLQRSRVCVICVTSENVNSPWLYYEAGAIAHAMQGALICPYLIGVEPRGIAGTPLGQYQATASDKDDTWRLVRDINSRLDSPHNERLLRGNFDARWPSLQRRLTKLTPEMKPDDPGPDEPAEPDLSPEAKHILIEASQDSHGTVLMVKTMGGFEVSTNEKSLCSQPDNPRVEAAYREAVNDLVSRGLLEPRGYKGEVFALTKRGYELADALRQQQA